MTSGLQTPTLFVIARDLATMQVSASVDESDIGLVAAGQPVTFSTDAYGTQVFTGTVTEVRLQPVVTQNVVTYTTIISVPNPGLKLKPGMTATVHIETARVDDTLRVPAGGHSVPAGRGGVPGAWTGHAEEQVCPEWRQAGQARSGQAGRVRAGGPQVMRVSQDRTPCCGRSWTASSSRARDAGRLRWNQVAIAADALQAGRDDRDVACGPSGTRLGAATRDDVAARAVDGPPSWECR